MHWSTAHPRHIHHTAAFNYASVQIVISVHHLQHYKTSLFYDHVMHQLSGEADVTRAALAINMQLPALMQKEFFDFRG